MDRRRLILSATALSAGGLASELLGKGASAQTQLPPARAPGDESPPVYSPPSYPTQGAAPAPSPYGPPNYTPPPYQPPAARGAQAPYRSSGALPDPGPRLALHLARLFSGRAGGPRAGCGRL